MLIFGVFLVIFFWLISGFCGVISDFLRADFWVFAANFGIFWGLISDF